MLATLHSCSKTCALDIFEKQITVNSLPDCKFRCFFRMESACNSVDLFFFYLVGHWWCLPSRYFPNFCALILFKEGWNIKQGAFFLLFKSVETTWAHGRYSYDFGTLTELFTSSSKYKKILPNLLMKPDTPIGYLDTMYTGLRNKWLTLKAIYSCFIYNQFFKPLYHVAGGSSCLFFYHRHAVYQVIEHRIDSCALLLCWPNSLFKTRNV